LTHTSYASEDLKAAKNENSSQDIQAVQVNGVKVQSTQDMTTKLNNLTRKLTNISFEDNNKTDIKGGEKITDGVQTETTKTDGVSNKGHMKTMHVEKTSANTVSPDGLTLENYKTADIVSNHNDSTQENVDTVKQLAQKGEDLMKLGSFESERRMDRKLEENDAEDTADKMKNYDN